MPRKFKHLVYDQRCQIYALKKSGLSQNKIAQQLGISQSTVSKELKRNSGQRGYRYNQAHEKATQRRKEASGIKKKMTPERTRFMEKLICENKMSPEQVSGFLRTQNNVFISTESIYQHVWSDKKRGGNVYKSLRQQGKKRNKRGSKNAGRGLIPNRVGIELRPEVVAAKERVGDWEGDTIIGAKHRGAIVSMVERKTKLVRLKLIPAANAKETTQATIDILQPLKDHVLTITTDNGKEFSGHHNITTALEAPIYFAQPYHSWERGLNENTNGLVRQFFPKKTDFTTLTHEQVQAVEDNLNNRPRKLLKFNTPNQEFLRLTDNIPSYAFRP